MAKQDSIVRCGNRECKKQFRKSEGFPGGLSNYCSLECRFARPKPTRNRPKKSHSSKTSNPSTATREYVLRRDDHRCRLCGGEYGLAIHHIYYRSDYRNKPWMNESWNLITLCNTPCHLDIVHNNKVKWEIRLLGLTWLSETCSVNYSVEDLEREFYELLRRATEIRFGPSS